MIEIKTPAGTYQLSLSNNNTLASLKGAYDYSITFYVDDEEFLHLSKELQQDRMLTKARKVAEQLLDYQL